MQRSVAWVVFAVVLVALVPSTARAQLSIYKVPQPAVGEKYNLEVGIGMWNPDPAITIASDKLTVVGSQVDAVADLGITKRKFTEYTVVLRPARKHKVRFEYLPVKYDAETVLSRTFVFRGVSYTIGLPVNSTLDFKSYRFGYEYDLIYRDRGYLGVVGEVKFTDVKATIASPLASAAASAQAPIPAIGAHGRVYVAQNAAVGGEFTAFKLPNSVNADYWGKYVDFDVYGLVNFTNNVGVQAGYRSLDLTYRVQEDSGTLTLKGLYVKGLVRF